ncbi:MAG TPA: SRPBCC domain-containing protein [Candidatus Angelobacter sp.]
MKQPEKIQQELVITRIFDAPREMVFRAWTEVEQIAQWWGPQGFTSPVCQMDVRPGGAIYIEMRGPDGTSYPMGGTFHKVVAPERLVFTSTALPDESGNPQLVNLNTVTFEDYNGKTRLKLHVQVMKATPAAAPALAGMEQGWSRSLDRLAGFVGR